MQWIPSSHEAKSGYARIAVEAFRRLQHFQKVPVKTAPSHQLQVHLIAVDTKLVILECFLKLLFLNFLQSQRVYRFQSFRGLYTQGSRNYWKLESNAIYNNQTELKYSKNFMLATTFERKRGSILTFN